MQHTIEPLASRQAAALLRLHDIAKAERELQDERDRLIADSRDKLGVKWSDICKFAEVTMPTAMKYADRARQGAQA